MGASKTKSTGKKKRTSVLNAPIKWPFGGKSKSFAKNTSQEKAAPKPAKSNALRTFWDTQKHSAIERTKPILIFYETRSKREQILLWVSAGILGIWLISSFIVTPYLTLRKNVQLAQVQTYEEYVWLESQISRLNELLQKRGAQRQLVVDPIDFIQQRLPNSEVTATETGAYTIIWIGESGTPFFATINALVDRGASLESIAFSRSSGREKQATYEALLKY